MQNAGRGRRAGLPQPDVARRYPTVGGCIHLHRVRSTVAARALARRGDEPHGGLKSCAEELVPIKRLMAGQASRKTVQSAFLTGLAGVSGFRERPWRLVRGGRGRVGLAAEVDGEEPMLVVIEIKGTGWDAMRNLCRYSASCRPTSTTAIEDMEAGQWEGIIGAMLYPAAPPAPRRWRRLRRSRAIVVPERYWRGGRVGFARAANATGYCHREPGWPTNGIGQVPHLRVGHRPDGCIFAAAPGSAAVSRLSSSRGRRWLGNRPGSPRRPVGSRIGRARKLR